jgi:nitrate/nitrite transporter NarK
MFVPIAVEWSWLAGNVAGSNKRAAATGLIFSSGNIGGAVAGQIYRAEWGPRYVKGHAVNLACYVVALIAATVLWWSYKTDNERRERERTNRADENGMLGQTLGELGDRSVNIS